MILAVAVLATSYAQGGDGTYYGPVGYAYNIGKHGAYHDIGNRTCSWTCRWRYRA